MVKDTQMSGVITVQRQCCLANLEDDCEDDSEAADPPFMPEGRQQLVLKDVRNASLLPPAVPRSLSEATTIVPRG